MRVDADLAHGAPRRGRVSALDRRRVRRRGGAVDARLGFRGPRTVEPSPAEIREAREATEAAVVVVDEGRVTLPSPHTQLDFGGIGVGYGLDRMASLLRGLGIRRAFIDISGDCIAIGAPPGTPGWPVSIVDPGHADATLGEVRLRDQALATSANTVASSGTAPGSAGM
jgi:thiamine biosynthesis lipoprotein